MKSSKLLHWIFAALLGLMTTGSIGLAQITNVIARADFDTYTWDFTYGYTYAGGDGGVGWADCSDATHSTSSNTAPLGVLIEGSNSQALLLTMDYTDLPNTPIWTNSHVYTYSGFGVNTVWNTWNMDLSPVTSTNLAAYLFSCDIKAFGLSSPAPVKITINFEVRDDFFLPPDSDSDPDVLFQAEYSAQVSSNFSHIEVLLDDKDMAIKKGTLADVINNMYEILRLRVEAKGDPAVPVFGYDADNGIVLDNISLASTYAPPPPPKVPFTVFEWNMDDRPLDYSWGTFNWSADTNSPQIYIPTYTYSTIGSGVGGSNGWSMQMDNSSLAPPNTPNWAGGNCGGGGPKNMSRFTDAELKNYVLECDVRAEGLAPDATQGAADVVLFMEGSLGLARLEFTFLGETNWLRSGINFNTANWNADNGRLPKASFATNFNTFTNLSIELQMNSAPNGSMWDYDANNLIVVDNIKLLHYVVGCPPLNITTETNHVIVTWNEPSSGTALLLSGGAPNAVTNEVLGASSPYVAPLGTTARYFRTRWVPPN